MLECFTRDLSNAKTFERLVADSLRDTASYAVEIMSQVQNVLNSQGRFIFPGGGTSDIKDLIFNKAGDLIIGLTYRKGEAA